MLCSDEHTLRRDCRSPVTGHKPVKKGTAAPKPPCSQRVALLPATKRRSPLLEEAPSSTKSAGKRGRSARRPAPNLPGAPGGATRGRGLKC